MSGISRVADFAYTIRFLKLLVTPFDKTGAYKAGIIDDTGKRIKTKRVVSPEDKSVYTKFHVLVFNLKKLMGKIPGGKTRLASYAAALLLLKEHGYISDNGILLAETWAKKYSNKIV